MVREVPRIERPSGLIRIRLLKGHVEGDIVRAVLRGRDFLQDHLALAVHLVIRERGILEKIGDQPQAQLDIAFEHARVIVGRLRGCHRVERAASPLDFLRDLHGCARRRALERHVLKKMGDAVLIVRFGPRARVDEHAHGRGFEARHAVAYDPETVTELAYLDCHGMNLK